MSCTLRQAGYLPPGRTGIQLELRGPRAAADGPFRWPDRLPERPSPDRTDRGGIGNSNYAIGQVALQFDSVGTGKDIYGQAVSTWGDISREIEEGTTMPINISADEVLKDPKTGYDMIGTMIRFGQNLLQNKRNGIENGIGEIDAVFNIMLSAQSKNGARINRFETTLDRNTSQFTSTSEIQSQLADTDLAEAYMNYSVTENVYNSALKTAAKIIQPSLVNFL